MTNPLGNYIKEYSNSSSCIKRIFVSRFVALSSTLLVGVQAIVHLAALGMIAAIASIASPFILLFLPCGTKPVVWKIINEFSKELKQLALTIGCLFATPVAALYDPQKMVAMQDKAEIWQNTSSASAPPKKRGNCITYVEGTPGSDHAKTLVEELKKDAKNTDREKYGLSKINPIITLCGPAKNGKKSYAKKVAEEFNSKELTTIDFKKMENTISFFKSLISIRSLKTLASSNTKVVYVKNLDPQDKSHLKILKTATHFDCVFLISTTKKITTLKVGRQIDLPLPLSEERKLLIENRLNKCTVKTQIEIDPLVKATEGMPRKKILKWVEQAIRRAYQEKVDLSNSHFLNKEYRTLLETVEKKLPYYAPNQELLKAFDRRLTVLKNWETLGEYMPAGILLHGPAGCGKTYSAKYLKTYAQEQHVPMVFVHMKASEVCSKWVGESSKNIRKVFETTQAVAPAILFIDEFEGLALQRSAQLNSSAVGNEKTQDVNTLLEFIEAARREKVIVIAATNFIDQLDPAMTRSGRFDTHIEMKLPDATLRKELLELAFKDFRLPLPSFIEAAKLLTKEEIITAVANAQKKAADGNIRLSHQLIQSEISAITTPKAAPDQANPLPAETPPQPVEPLTAEAREALFKKELKYKELNLDLFVRDTDKFTISDIDLFRKEAMITSFQDLKTPIETIMKIELEKITAQKAKSAPPLSMYI